MTAQEKNKTKIFLAGIILLLCFLLILAMLMNVAIQKNNQCFVLLIEYTNEQNQFKKDSLYNEYTKAHEEAKNYEKIIPFL